MTIEQLKQLEKDFLTPVEIAPILGCNPYSINCQVKKDASALGFPVIRLGSRVKIPRIPFLAFLGVLNE